MEHTPGPWRPYFFVGNRRLKTGHWGMIGGDGMPLFCCGVKAAVGNQEADIRLAAAAPDLLAVCQEILQFMVPDDDDTGPATRLRMAVSKAIGEDE